MLLPPFMLAKRMRHKIDRIDSEIRGALVLTDCYARFREVSVL
jgi:hypothetical protein